ncbi:hypothetical protein [Kribbella sp. NPDC049584]|uniref:hypothetical protein n=1 Tax=Kribbella sp. NPDC049584 TaxID=3154833 RepID=UPI00344480E3
MNDLQDNALVTSRSDHHVYVLRDGKLRWIPDAWTMQAEGLSPTSLQVLEDADFAELELGDAIPSAVPAPKLDDDTIVETDTGLWRAKQNRLHPIPDPMSLQQAAYDGQVTAVWLQESLVRSMYADDPAPEDTAPADRRWS